jgi:hypothetical protein
MTVGIAWIAAFAARDGGKQRKKIVDITPTCGGTLKPCGGRFAGDLMRDMSCHCKKGTPFKIRPADLTLSNQNHTIGR